jgi:hypothetical protein
MSSKTDRKVVVIVTIIIIILGVLLHYVYAWSNENKLVGYVAPVNESVWEHLKLLVFPLLIVVSIEVYYLQKSGRQVNNKWLALFFATIVGMVLIIAIFYTYTGAITGGESLPVIDIATFVVVVIIAVLIVHAMFGKKQACSNVQSLSMIGIILVIGLIFICTYNPPELPLFEETLTA